MKTQEQLTNEDLRYVNAVLCNDESSTDEELVTLFEEELDISKALAETIVSFRERAFFEIRFDIHYYLEGRK